MRGRIEEGLLAFDTSNRFSGCPASAPNRVGSYLQSVLKKNGKKREKMAEKDVIKVL